MTTFDPGARDVLTQGLVVIPRSTAFRARSPAATITEGLDVLVQLVMAAITACPWSRVISRPSARRTGTWTSVRAATAGCSGSPRTAAGRSTGAVSPPIASLTSEGSLAGNDDADAA